MKDRILNTLLLLTVAAALGVSLLRGAPPSDAALLSDAPIQTQPTLHPGQAYREQRARRRRQEQTEIAAALAGEALSAEARRDLEDALVFALQADEKELAVEGALAGLGYENALCVYREGTLTVFADRALTERDAALILDLARENAHVAEENVRITGY